MANILVFVEFTNGKIKSGSLELLSFARNQGETIALALGPGAKALQGEAGKFGVRRLVVNEDTSFATYNPQLFSETLAQVIQQFKPGLVLASGTMVGRDLFPRVAAKVEAGVISDCTELKISGTDVTVRKPFFSGKCSAQGQFASGSTKIVVMRPNQLTIAPADAATSPEITEVGSPSSQLRVLVKEVVKGASTKLDLAEANIIVSGGRGMKGPEHFKLLHDLADVLGATVGASRAVVDAGWVPHNMQVGQTGKTVAPVLYIACGISGAIQHLAGMSSSKVVVAINKDPEAPIFKKATYGIVGDVFEVLPVLTEEFRKILAH